MRFFSHGIVNSDGVKIPDTQPTNVFVPVDRKIIQPNITSTKVHSICPASRHEGSSLLLIVPSGKVMVATVSR